MTLDLAHLVDAGTYQFLLVFVRIGSAIMLLPGIGDLRVPVRLRLTFAVALSAIVAANIGDRIPSAPDEFWQVAGEVGIGLFIGTTAAFLMSILQMAGSVIAAQIGLGNALSNELFSVDQGASIGVALSTAGLVIIFTSGLDHLMLGAVVHSYDGLPVGKLTALGDLADSLTSTLSAAFAVAVQLSTPFLVLGLAFNFGLALANRALPQLPVFFVGL